LTPVSNHNDLRDEPARHQQALDPLGSDVFPSARLYQVLLPIRDSQVPVLVNQADVARSKPTVLGERLGIKLWAVMVASSHLIAPRQDFAVGCNLDLYSSDDAADGPDVVMMLGIRRNGRRRLGQSVALQNRDTRAHEDICNLRREGCPT